MHTATFTAGFCSVAHAIITDYNYCLYKTCFTSENAITQSA